MKTYTEQEVIELFEKFEKDRSLDEDVLLIKWLFDNGLQKNYVGQKYKDIVNSFEEQLYYSRLVKKDGKHCMITSDLIPERLNFEIENGIITKQYNG